jgi:hypothetical protein
MEVGKYAFPASLAVKRNVGKKLAQAGSIRTGSTVLRRY